MLIFATAGTFSVYVMLGNELLPHLVFPSLSIFASLLRILLEVAPYTFSLICSDAPRMSEPH
jgi:hypothetical protein